MIAPASVPQEMIIESFHHKLASPPRVGIVNQEMMKVTATEIMDVIHTKEVRGASKFIFSSLLKRAFAIASLMK